MENCLVTISQDHVYVTSTVVGYHDGKPYQVNYRISANTRWEIRSFHITHRSGSKERDLDFFSVTPGIWTANGEPQPLLNGCLDIDISLTPFTNTLPVKRLPWHNGKTQIVDVIYFDLLDFNIKRAQQQYKQMSKNQFHYANLPNDFEALITVDDDGFVADYPQLFERELKYVSEGS